MDKGQKDVTRARRPASEPGSGSERYMNVFKKSIRKTKYQDTANSVISSKLEM